MNIPRQQSEVRYERKFRIEELKKEEVEILIRVNPGHFKEIHHPRKINNLYLDTVYLSYYHENLAGISDRKKFRIRWYGSPFIAKDPVLEIKVKKGYLSEKFRYPLRDFNMDSSLTMDKIKSMLITSGIPLVIKEEIKSLKLSLFNSYWRRYFLSANKKYRLTLDYNLEFRNINFGKTLTLTKIQDNAVIVELKYNTKDDVQACNITSKFPFNLTKNSKYITGVEKTCFL